MHLYDDILDGYLACELPPATAAQIDAHVSNCLFCAQTLAATQMASTTWERRGWLGRLVRVEQQRVVGAAEDELRRAA
jgi:hypothetical protein